MNSLENLIRPRHENTLLVRNIALIQFTAQMSTIVRRYSSPVNWSLGFALNRSISLPAPKSFVLNFAESHSYAGFAIARKSDRNKQTLNWISRCTRDSIFSCNGLKERTFLQKTEFMLVIHLILRLFFILKFTMIINRSKVSFNKLRIIFSVIRIE